MKKRHERVNFCYQKSQAKNKKGHKTENLCYKMSLPSKKKSGKCTFVL